ncbi:MAG: Abi family protein [Ruegeria sp.]
MQDFSTTETALVNSMKSSLSAARFSKYLHLANGNETHALHLYQWNSLLSQAFYLNVQCWEVCLRNKLNAFLCWKYNKSWPYDEQRAVRQLKSGEKTRLFETRRRQEQERKQTKVPTDVIVADLSAGFWVSMLATSYEIPFGWRNNLKRVFPNDTALDRRAAWEICSEIRDLRNRIAHHEPIHQLPLETRYRDLQRIVAAMCPGTFAFMEANCRFREVFNRRPST